MPTYRGMLDQQQIAQLVAAVRGLADAAPEDGERTADR